MPDLDVMSNVGGVGVQFFFFLFGGIFRCLGNGTTHKVFKLVFGNEIHRVMFDLGSSS